MNPLAEALRYYQDGQYDEAARRLRLTVEFDRDNAQAWLYLGAARAQLGQWAGAVEAYRQVLRLQPEEASAYCDLAAACLELKEYRQAEQALASALLLEPLHPVAAALRERLEREAPAAPVPAEPAEVTPAEPSPPPRRSADGRLPLLLWLLAALLLVTAILRVPWPGRAGRELRAVAALLDRAAATQKTLAASPGEDFRALDGVRALQDRAGARLDQAVREHGRSAEASLLAARLLWQRDRSALATRDKALEALGQLADRADETKGLTGQTTLELRAAAYRLLAETELPAAMAGNTAALARGRKHLEQARRLAPAPRDTELQAAYDRAAQRLRPTGSRPNQPAGRAPGAPGR